MSGETFTGMYWQSKLRPKNEGNLLKRLAQCLVRKMLAATGRSQYALFLPPPANRDTKTLPSPTSLPRPEII